MEKEGGAVINLRQLLTHHVDDMHEWKEFLAQDRKYESFDLNNRMEFDLNDKDTAQKSELIDRAFNDETALIAKIFEMRHNNGTSTTKTTSSEERTPEKSTDPDKSPKGGKSHSKKGSSRKSPSKDKTSSNADEADNS